jgi:hypothetical protein
MKQGKQYIPGEEDMLNIDEETMLHPKLRLKLSEAAETLQALAVEIKLKS